VKYLCLIYTDAVATSELRPNESTTLLDERFEYRERLRSSGHLLAAEALHPADAATTIRMRNGRAWASDGAVVHNPGSLAGFVLLDVRDLNAAIQLAARNPAARYGAVEIRPIRDPEVAGSRVVNRTSSRGDRHECT
jgi:hypothetical protein